MSEFTRRHTTTINRTMSRMLQLVLFSLLISSVLSKSIPSQTREKRHATDQRVVELQALLALAKSLPDVREVFGHGHVNPFAAGRRRRSVGTLIDNERSVMTSTVLRKPDEDDPISISATGDDRLMQALLKVARRRALMDERR